MAKRIKKELSGHWYSDLTPEGRAQYHRDHPNSRLGQGDAQRAQATQSGPVAPARVYDAEQLKSMALSSALRGKDRLIAQTASMNPDLPFEDMKFAVKHKDACVRKTFALNPKCPATFLETLAEDKDHTVVHAALSNKNTPAHVLSKAFKENPTDPFIQEKIVGNKNCPADIFEKVMVTGSSRAKQNIASNRFVGEAPLVHLSKSKDLEVLRNVAANEKTPKEILQSLATHSDSDVRAAAKKNHKTKTEAQLKIRELMHLPISRWDD